MGPDATDADIPLRGQAAPGTPRLELERLAAQERSHPDCDPLQVQALLWIYRAYNALNSTVSEDLRPHGLSTSGFNVLLALNNSPGQALEPWELAERLLVSRPSITGLLDTLQAKGLIRRSPHIADGRRVIVGLTEQGRDRLNAVLTSHYAVLAKALEGLTPDELANMVVALRKVRGATPRHLEED